MIKSTFWPFLLALFFSLPNPVSSRTDLPTLDIGPLAIHVPIAQSQKGDLEFAALQKKTQILLRQEVYADKEAIQEIINFVKSHSGEVSGLSAKLLLGYYLAISRKSFPFAKENWNFLVGKALEIFHSISENFSNSWQGKLAGTHSLVSFQVGGGADPSAVL